MKGKIIATFMALGMVLTAFSLMATANDGNIEPTGTPEAVLARVAPALDGTQASLAAGGPNGICYAWETAEAFVPGATVSTFGANSKGIAIDIAGTWTYVAATYSQCSGDAGSIWDAWATGETAAMVYEVFNDQGVSGRNYTMIYEEAAMDGDGSTNFGANSAQNAMTLINDPVLVGEWEANNTAFITIAAQTTGAELLAWLTGYGVYKSTTGPITQSNQGTYLGDATLVGGVWQYKDLAYSTAGNNYYAVKVRWNAATFFAPLYSYGMSNDVVAFYGLVSTDFAPETSGLGATAYTGSTVTESVTFTATVTDTDPVADVVTGARISINGAPTVAMTAVDGAFDETSEAVTYTYSLPNGQAAGTFPYTIAGQDGVEGWNATPASSTFTLSDSTDALSSYTGSTPAGGANLYAGSTATVDVSYADFTAFNAAQCILYYRVNATAWNNVALGNTSFAWGSYTNNLRATFPVSGIGGTMSFYATVGDLGGGALVTLPTRTINVLANAGNVGDPFPVYGYVYLYNGNAGAYAPVVLANAAVTITWFNTSSTAWSTIATTSNGLGQYSVDIMNYTDGAVVFCNATAPAPYNNAGYNYTTISFVTGGAQQNIVCGVPYDVVITAPLAGANVVISTPFAVTYRINDRNGVLCQGYYTFADGPMNMRGMVVAFLAPADYTFNGIASATPGTRTDNFRFDAPAGLRTLNVSEGGAAEANPYLTPWGAWNMYSGAAGYLKDWALVQVNVLGGGFNWHLVNGWNLVSVPADPIGKGTNAVFDSFDALALCFAVSGDLTLSAAQRNLGTTPSTYVNFDYGMAEAGAFAMGSIYGYWIYTTTVLPYDVNVLALNYSAGSNVVNVVAGWNLLGFTHNMGVTGGTGWGWVGAPTASDFTDGTITAALTLAGPLTKIVATWWNANSQWYNSYVATDTFPGMVAHDWTYDTNYAYGYWVWSSGAVVVTFNVNY